MHAESWYHMSQIVCLWTGGNTDLTECTTIGLHREKIKSSFHDTYPSIQKEISKFGAILRTVPGQSNISFSTYEFDILYIP